MTQSLSATVREEWHIFLNGLRFFTRIRVPDRIPHSEAMLSLAPKYLPVIGLLVGGACALTFALSIMVLPQSISVLLAMTAGLLITLPAVFISGLVMLIGSRHLPREMALMLARLKATKVNKA